MAVKVSSMDGSPEMRRMAPFPRGLMAEGRGRDGPGPEECNNLGLRLAPDGGEWVERHKRLRTLHKQLWRKPASSMAG